MIHQFAGSKPQRTLLLAAGALAFALAATANAAGYRYGVADQAFYVPAVLQHLDHNLFPRDGALIGSQARLLVFDELFAWIHTSTSISIPLLFFAGYLATLGVAYTALVALGRHFFVSGWTVAAFVAAATLRHRITKTGANTLEGHFHPRMLAFAIGLCALVAVMRRRTLAAWLLVALAGTLHPTTAIWFAIWIGVAFFVHEPRLRWPLAIAALTLGGAAAVIFVRSSLSLAPMDDAWVAAFADKDYIFPTTDWSVGSWLLNLLLPAIIIGTFVARRRAGVVHDREAGIVAGCLVLVAIFVGSLPFIAMRSALIVQLQVSRVFWMADLLATIYALWWIAEAAALARANRGARASWRAPALAIVLTLAAAGRGWYVWTVEHADRPLVGIDLPADEWRDVSLWIRAHTAPTTHVLVDPGHAWKYGTSVRVSAERDVLLEDVKDAAIALYDRAVALRVTERRAALQDFDRLDAAQVRALQSRYDLQYLVTERSSPVGRQPDGQVPFDEVYRNARFHVYRLSR